MSHLRRPSQLPPLLPVELVSHKSCFSFSPCSPTDPAKKILKSYLSKKKKSFFYISATCKNIIRSQTRLLDMGPSDTPRTQKKKKWVKIMDRWTIYALLNTEEPVTNCLYSCLHPFITSYQNTKSLNILILHLCTRYVFNVTRKYLEASLCVC